MSELAAQLRELELLPRDELTLRRVLRLLRGVLRLLRGVLFAEQRNELPRRLLALRYGGHYVSGVGFCEAVTCDSNDVWPSQ